jgi:flavin-binding protein dodecin
MLHDRDRIIVQTEMLERFGGIHDALRSGQMRRNFTDQLNPTTKTLRDLRVAEVNKLDLVMIDGKVAAFRVRVNLSFKYEGKD